MPIFVSDMQDMQDQAADTMSKMITAAIIIAGVMITLFIVLAFCMLSRRKSTMGGNIKEGEKSVYFSGYGKAKKKVKQENQIQGTSSKSTKVCKTCGRNMPNDAEICSSCGSNEFQY